MSADPAKRVLVDTNVASWIGAGRGRHAEWAAAFVGRRPFVSFVTVGEILLGDVMAGWSEAKVGEMLGRPLARHTNADPRAGVTISRPADS